MSEPPPLKSLFIQITHRCNLDCTFCAASGAPSDVEIPALEVLRVVKAGQSLGLDYVFFTGGEPFVRSDFERILKDTVQLGVRVAIATNGSLLSRFDLGWMSRVPTNSISLAMSLDGAKAETHDVLRGCSGAFQRTMASIRRAVGLGIPVVIQTLLQRGNAQEILGLAAMASDLSAEFRVIPEIVPKGRGQAACSATLAIDEIMKVAADLWAAAPHLKTRALVKLPPALLAPDLAAEMSRSCFWGRHVCGIMPNGDVTMCHGCLAARGSSEPPFLAGNLRRSNLQQIWNESAVFRVLREFDPNSFLGVCGRCVLRAYCRGFCRLRAILEYGDFRAPEVLCQRAYERGLFPRYMLEPTS